MTFTKVVISDLADTNWYSLPIAPTSWNDGYLGLSQISRAVDGTMVAFNGAVKKSFSWSGQTDASQLSALRAYFQAQTAVHLKDPAGSSHAVRFTNFSSTLSSRAVATYTATCEEL